jgi:hypothetical protein
MGFIAFLQLVNASKDYALNVQITGPAYISARTAQKTPFICFCLQAAV